MGHGRMTRIPFDDWILSGRQIFLAEGVDFHEMAEEMKAKLQKAARRRGLRVATKTIFDPPGFMFQTYAPDQSRPVLSAPTQPANKKTHSHLYCREIGCNALLRPRDDEFCEAHS